MSATRCRYDVGNGRPRFGLVEQHHVRGNRAAVEPERPEVGYRANNALIGHDEPIVVPRQLTGPLEAEPEAVIGRPLRRAST